MTFPPRLVSPLAPVQTSALAPQGNHTGRVNITNIKYSQTAGTAETGNCAYS
jgi:hypothetical protein